MERDTMAYWGDTYALHWRPRPLVQPAAEDVAFFEAAALQESVSGRGKPLRALLLGVTRAIAAMQWPADTRLLSLDWSEPVLRRLWSAEGPPPGSAIVRGDWREMPLGAGALDIALSDGSYHCLTGHEDGQLLTRELARVLRAGGLFCTRTFLAPDPPERLDDLFEELQAGAAGSLHVFRWRLAAAMQGRSGVGVPRADIWRVWNERVGDPRRLKETYGEDDRGFAVLERFQGLSGRLFYYTRAEFEALLAPAFERAAFSIPSYEGGGSFPRHLFRRRT